MYQKYNLNLGTFELLEIMVADACNKYNIQTDMVNIKYSKYPIGFYIELDIGSAFVDDLLMYSGLIISKNNVYITSEDINKVAPIANTFGIKMICIEGHYHAKIPLIWLFGGK